MTDDGAEVLARLFHETYERLAPTFGYRTRERSAVPWADVPDDNKQLMVATAGEVIAAGWRYEPDTLRAAADDVEVGVSPVPGTRGPTGAFSSAERKFVDWLRARADSYLPPAAFRRHLERTGGLRTCDLCGLTLGDCRCPVTPDDPQRLAAWAQRAEEADRA